MGVNAIAAIERVLCCTSQLNCCIAGIRVVSKYSCQTPMVSTRYKYVAWQIFNKLLMEIADGKCYRALWRQSFSIIVLGEFMNHVI